jgi:hypothetical protein
MQPTDLQKRRFRDALWYAAGYEPTRGEFPIYDMDGKLVTTSHGQLEVHESTARIKQIAGGERAGKSMCTAMDAAGDILKEGGRMWICGPDYTQSKAEFQYIHDALLAMGCIQGQASMPDKGPQSLTTTWGFEIETKSGQDLMKIASFATDIFIITEGNQHAVGILNKAYGRVSERRGRIIISGTIEAANPWYVEKWETWQGPNAEGAQSFSLPSWSNDFIYPGGREDPEIKLLEARLGPEVFLERCAAIPCKPSGLVFKEFDRRKHVKQLDYNPNLPVELAIDPATHTYAIEALQFETLSVKQWLERAENEALLLKRTKEELDEQLTKVYVFDEVYAHDLIAQDVIPIVQSKPWYSDVKRGVIDVAGTQRNATKSQVQIWAEETGISLASSRCLIPQHIAVYRLRLRDNPLIGEPLIQFDYRLRSDKNHQGKPNGVVAEHNMYKWPTWTDQGNERRVPVDKFNDGVKAISYFEFMRFGPVEERATLKPAKIGRYF